MCSPPQFVEIDGMDEKHKDGMNEFTANSTDISTEKGPDVQQKKDENLKQTNSVQPEKNIVSIIPGLKLKRKYSCIPDEASNKEQSGNPSEEVKNTGFGSKNIPLYSSSFLKSDVLPRNKESNEGSRSISNEHISSNAASQICCRNQETVVNAKGTMYTLENAIVAAGPSGIIPQMHKKKSKNRFASKFCNKEFAESQELDIHDGRHHTKKAFVDESKFAQQVDLDRHRKAHIDDRPYVCDVCKRRFTKPSDLKIHYRIHTGEKPYVCDVCKKRFTQMGNLKNHCKIHTGEKPFVCEVCKKRFAHKKYLESHYRTHTGEKPFACDICKKRFTSQIVLKVHYRTHTAEKPYSCEVCKKDFAGQGNLVKHARRHTEERPLYECSTCGKTYLDISNYRRHYKAKHE